jgi:hypothetical protein
LAWRGSGKEQQKGSTKVSKIPPFHTNSPEYPPEHRNVYHNDSACPDGKRIEQRHRIDGDGNRLLCKECAKL